MFSVALKGLLFGIGLGIVLTLYGIVALFMLLRDSFPSELLGMVMVFAMLRYGLRNTHLYYRMVREDALDSVEPIVLSEPGPEPTTLSELLYQTSQRAAELDTKLALRLRMYGQWFSAPMQLGFIGAAIGTVIAAVSFLR
jgi:hypothetical protein